MNPQATGAARIETLSSHRDARGSLFEPLNAAELAQQQNVHVVLTQPGEVRGNHWHRTATEMTTVVGPCQVRLKEGGAVRDVTVPAGETWRFTLPPGVVHAYRNTGEATMVLVSFASALHDPANPDTVREVIL
jgi:dTDP-4-dehydrorhamnose 3,5-epimerase-like enzyme